ncbi:MAG: 50S ribosomal protein L25/general stress protein Ctc [Sphingomonadales bacterium]|nr:50S ribosomal protein L25/general stress protein Ctc [Sphingomonadales bacterium]PIX67347.1 MAG: 50S ribosomal protein L25 [Sphingomonadales bacterium CG_4_10_14_3_um_filter_58_15]NCO48077.1 50S ribosomal protein L25/general stress protein Ctc [Sphingomonadales bacterium]NCO99647.1 50S ribosomal protein L25/general stress protein Ctc [Sphingomonadales bacterium]NCP27210.1 50S ribosomal protein L25/general stress protein Ctc [Sphingomonadales bacterium]
MSDQLTISAEPRERAGKGASRALRREGRVPAVIYGDKKEAVAIHVEARALNKLLGTGHFMNSLIQVEVNGVKTRTLPKDVAFDPVSDRPLHVDFFRLAKGAKVQVNIPVVFINQEDSPGLKRGGVMNVVRHELDLMCDADHIPDQIEIDVTGLEIGDSIHISSITLPKGAESAITDRDFTIAGVTAPSALKSSDDEAAEDDAADETEVTEQDADTVEGEDS